MSINLREPSIRSLILGMSFQGTQLATGTGFVVNSARGWVLVTNLHNVTGRDPQTNKPLSPTGGVPDEITIMHNQQNKLGNWITRTEPLYNAGISRWIMHPVLGNQADFVALPLTQLNDVQIYPYDLNVAGPQLVVGPADTVSVVGFPFGLQGGGSLAIWATGFVASEPDVDYQGQPVFLIDCRSRPGQSGSAVIAFRSAGAIPMDDGATHIYTGSVTRFLGIYSGRINAQSDLGIVWKAAAIKQLVDSII